MIAGRTKRAGGAEPGFVPRDYRGSFPLGCANAGQGGLENNDNGAISFVRKGTAVAMQRLNDQQRIGRRARLVGENWRRGVILLVAVD